MERYRVLHSSKMQYKSRNHLAQPVNQNATCLTSTYNMEWGREVIGQTKGILLK